MLGFFDDEHGGLDNVRLYGNCNRANLGHTVLWRILRVFVEDALSLMRLRPELFEESIVNPSISRSRERFCEDTAVGYEAQVSESELLTNHIIHAFRRWIDIPWPTSRQVALSRPLATASLAGSRLVTAAEAAEAMETAP